MATARIVHAIVQRPVVFGRAGRILDVVLSLYAIVVFATVAGILGAYFVERRHEERPSTRP